MWKATEALTLIQAAERAAEAGNYPSAENLLRDAARLQETHLGPRHADLANTLNNLGIVCEVTGKPEDAEQYFRRAVSIARTSLPPDHPFVATSQKNLRDFCESRGKKVDLPVEVPAKPSVELEAPAAPPPPEPTKPAPDVEVTAKEVEVTDEEVEVTVKDVEVTVKVETPMAPEPEDPEVTSKKFFMRVALGALGPIAMLMVVLAAGLPRLGAPELHGATSPAEPITPISAPPPPPTPAPVSAPAEPIAPPEEEPAATPAAASTKEVDDVAPAASARPVVIRASLCGGLEDWSCDPADRPVPEGPLFFYTQIKSPGVTTIQHRWYHGGRLLQSVRLRVQPNRDGGYRTYSRNVMKSESAGNWKVELRSEDGALLYEERFTVR